MTDLRSENENKPIHTAFLSYACKVWNSLTSPLGTEQEIHTSAFLQSARMQEGKQLFRPTSITSPTFPEPLNCLFNRSQSSQNKYGSKNSCVQLCSETLPIVATMPQASSCFQWKLKKHLLSTRICLCIHLSAVVLDTNVSWLQNKLLLFHDNTFLMARNTTNRRSRPPSSDVIKHAILLT